MIRVVALVGVLAAFAASSACRHRPRLAVLPPPRAASVLQHSEAELMTEPPAPDFAPELAVDRPFVIQTQVPIPPPPPAPARPRRVIVAPAPKYGPEVPAPVVVPELALSFSGQERAKALAEVAASIQQARRDLQASSRTRLSPAQRQIRHQVEVFIEEAGKMRQTDLAGAQALARKAAIMARNLAGSTR